MTNLSRFLFRGRTLNGFWATGLLSEYKDSIFITQCTTWDGLPGWDKQCTYEVDKDTVAAYTGLDAADGGKIFEGDIVCCKDGSRYRIEWCQDRCCYECCGLEYSKNQTSFPLTCDIACECNIV